MTDTTTTNCALCSTFDAGLLPFAEKVICSDCWEDMHDQLSEPEPIFSEAHAYVIDSRPA